ncbi:MAG TPA: hypothetical protein VH062_35275 [Polyangiaceae bacterium]|jgi:hypothetical protein|nr:hypothetical protein [Polyangiaceae bacterium]
MAKLNRLIDGTTLSLAAAALALAGCGSNTDGVSATGGAGGAPTVGAGGAVTAVGAGGSAAPAGAGNSVGTAGTTGGVTTPPAGAGGTAVAPPGAGGSTVTSPGAGGASVTPPGAGGSPATASTGGTAGTTGPVNGTADDLSWDATKNVDASGNLIKPAADQGFQVATPLFELDPGQEVFKCYHTAFPNSGEFDVGDWESVMAKGSHHFILYKTDSDFSAPGTFDAFGCTVSPSGGEWIYSAAVPHTHLSMPDGVAMPLASGQKVQFDMHYINTGTDPLQAHVTVNVNKVTSAQFQKAQSQVSFNVLINIPANGMQTVGGDCTPAAGGKYFMMLTHTHRRGVDASITRKLASGQMGEVLVHTTNWDSPSNILWENPPYLTFQAGEKFHYQCQYKNDRSSATTVGVSAANNEMCMAITYFFPAASPPACTSDVE